MSYPYSTADFTVPVRPPGHLSGRPGTVTVAAWLLFGTAVCFVLLMATFAYDLANYPAWADAAAAKLQTDPATVAAAKSDNSAGQIASLVLTGLLVVALLASGILALRQRRTGQIMAYALVVVTMLCCGAGAILGIASTSSESAFDQATLDAGPGWIDGLSLLAGFALPLAVAAFVLLLMPSARRFFRRTPVAPAGYMYLPAPGFPGAPVYPDYPGYPPPQQWVAPSYSPPPYPPAPPADPRPTGTPLMDATLMDATLMDAPPTDATLPESAPPPAAPHEASPPNSPPPPGPTDAV